MNVLREPAETDRAPPTGDHGAEGPRVTVIMNAGSGDSDKDADERRIEAFFAGRPGFLLKRVARGGDLAREARQVVAERAGIVVAAGGDGTVSAVAGAVAGSACRLGVLPLGTFNYFARGLGIPDDLDEALAVLDTGTPRRIAIGAVNDATFLNNASLGLYPHILRERESIYRRWGRSRAAAYWSVLRALFDVRRPLSLAVSIDGATRRFRTPLVFVANNAFQLELMGLEGGDVIAADRLAVFVAPDCSRLEIALRALRLALGLAKPQDDFELLSGSEVVVEAKRAGRQIALDGERRRMASPFRFERRPRALEVLVPASSG
ncbi:MAG TPA: diacylglycerol kinase family protein [Thermohalobaculum sp.]|nr:diacylglycerol kinase family protein [Thermohalobaculum sp.]